MKIRHRTGLSLTSAAKVRERVGQTNAFSLPASSSVCLYATPTCSAGCYAKKGRFRFKYVRNSYHRNWRVLRKARKAGAMAELLTTALAAERFALFRIHVSGEFFSLHYAKAWRLTCREYLSALFWAYTRSRDSRVLKVLAQIPNLRLLLSCDQDNWRQMLQISRQFPGFGLSYYTVGEQPPARLHARADAVAGGLVVFPDRSVRNRLAIPGTCPT